MVDGTTLVFGHRPSGSSRALLKAAADRGIGAVQLTGPEPPADLIGCGAHLYSGLLLADALASALGITLLEAAPGWLADLPEPLRGRDIVLVPIAEAYGLRRPVFVKSPNDKRVRAGLYADGAHLPGPDAVDPETLVLVADPVSFAAEFRLHVLDGAVHAGSQYASNGSLALAPLDGHPHHGAVLGFAREVLAACAATLPSAIVVDVGLTVDAQGTERWAVVEANGAWGSGCYAADPQRALDVVLRASGTAETLSRHDLRFART
ncbi:ATP-grasp domain-containing protein [Spirillospora sp. NBC_01491]|uniref:ATP-grasp domain-containing protein n=1 Tax=Spirillospora sp. NBC_01491 TaxID=2976007 RepID=UPI002E365CAA|nr:ATP-grasp domain-containing protein [Spirillospora sp. NBC_01491]